jgi:hypothetical protein
MAAASCRTFRQGDSVPSAARRFVWERVRRSGYAGLRTDAHWTRLLASDVVPGDLAGHLQHHYAVWRQAAAQVRALD